jgi:hypothetical protein
MSILVRETDPRAQEGRLSVSEKLDLLRTLIVAVEGESRPTPTGEEAARSGERGGCAATELYSEPSFCLVLREFSEEVVFGRESVESEVECHVVLDGRIRVYHGIPGPEVGRGDCRSLSRPGDDRLVSAPGARVVSTYSPRLTLDALLPAAEAAAEAPGEARL